MNFLNKPLTTAEMQEACKYLHDNKVRRTQHLELIYQSYVTKRRVDGAEFCGKVHYLVKHKESGWIQLASPEAYDILWRSGSIEKGFS